MKVDILILIMDIVEFYNWVGDNTRRYGAITYLDGSYAHEVGNDSLKYYDTWKNYSL